MLHRPDSRFFLHVQLILLSALTSLPACAADDEILARIQSAYAKNDFAQAIELSKKLAERSPASANAHYIVGNCYLKLQNLEEARRHYEFCRTIQPKGESAAYATRALSYMSSPPPGNAETNAAAPASSSQSPAGEKMNSRVKSQLEELYAKRNQETRNMLNRQYQEQDRHMQMLNKDVQKQIDAVPKLVTGAQGQMVVNSDYDDEVSRIREDAERKLAVLQREAERIKAKLDALEKTPQDTIDKERLNAASHTSLGNGLIKVTAQGSDVFVKNYMNFAGEPVEPPQVPLKGSMKKLQIGDVKQQPPMKVQRKK